MPFDVAAVQDALRAAKLDGWLLYDFHGSNPIAARLLGTADGAKMTTRRWFYLVPAAGEPARAGARDRAENARRAAGRQERLCRTPAARRGVDEPAERHEARSRWSTRATARFRMCRASTRERWISFASAGSKLSRPAISCRGSRPCGMTTRLPPIARRRRRSTG